MSLVVAHCHLELLPTAAAGAADQAPVRSPVKAPVKSPGLLERILWSPSVNRWADSQKGEEAQRKAWNSAMQSAGQKQMTEESNNWRKKASMNAGRREQHNRLRRPACTSAPSQFCREQM